MEVEKDGGVVSTFTVLVIVVVLPALSFDLNVTEYTPSISNALGCQAPPSIATCALANPDPESKPSAATTTGPVTNQSFKPSGEANIVLSDGGVASTCIILEIIVECPALSVVRKLIV
jgi:hypothetical protein